MPVPTAAEDLAGHRVGLVDQPPRIAESRSVCRRQAGLDVHHLDVAVADVLG
ncbi:MAG: hypothetical protein AB7N24_11705 [Dehalococcoidia bacterium]